MKYEKVKLDDLFSNLNKYEGRYIEVEGYFIVNRNETAIYKMSQVKEAIWVSFKEDNLFDDKGNSLLNSNAIDDLSDKNVIIKGKFDSKNRGNLALYKGSITNISYIGSN